MSVLATVALLLLPGPASGGGVPGFGCEGDPPDPASPYVSGVTVRPEVTSDGDPFTDEGVSLESVYGTTPQWWSYDNGCSPTAGFMPGMGAGLGNLGLQLSGALPNWTHALIDAVITPSGWLAPLDEPVASATRAVAAGVWTPWLLVVLTLVAVLVLVRAWSGNLSASVTTAVWALLVLVAVSWTINYPTESVELIDSGVRTAVIGVAEGFDNSPGADGGEALGAVDRQMDQVVRHTQYRAWSIGVFGDPDSDTARKYGPRVFRSTHFTWDEYDAYLADPDGEGKKIREAKQEDFKEVAEEIKDSDPLAYSYFTGDRWGQRLGTALLNLLITATVGLFLIAASICMLVAFVLIRVFVPFSPALGIVYMVEPVRDRALTLMKRAFGPVVMGPVYFLAALVMLRFESEILPADIPFPVKLAVILVLSWLAWRLLRPHSNLVRVRIPGLHSLTAFLAGRSGTQRAAPNSRPDEMPDQPRGTPAAAAAAPNSSGQLVYQELGGEPAPTVVSTGPPAPALPAGPTTPGTFLRRPDDARPLGRSPSARELREESLHPDRAGPRRGRDALAEPMTVYLSDGPPVAGAVNGTPVHAPAALEEPQPVPSRPLPAEVHEANLTFDEDGQEVFVVYAPALAGR